MKKQYTLQQAREKIRRYCAYQERCHHEVRQKLFEYGVTSREADELIVELITENFLNEERYAKAFVGGKFRIKKWGRIKIVNALESNGLSNNCISSGLKEIDENEYSTVLKDLLEKKCALLNNEPNVFVKRDKLSQYAIQKGYEPALAWKFIREILPD